MVQQGDCLSTIAARFGYSGWQLLWNDPANEGLREQRKNPNVLFPGDSVALPDEAKKKVSLQTDQDYEVRVTQSTTRIRVRLLDGDDPIAGEAYELTYPGVALRGTTDGDGVAEQKVPIDLAEATLRVASRGVELLLQIGHLDPATTVSGAQARLRALGIYEGAADGDAGPKLTDAVQAFQSSRQLDPTGDLDGRTADALEESYGC